MLYLHDFETKDFSDYSFEFRGKITQNDIDNVAEDLTSLLPKGSYYLHPDTFIGHKFKSANNKRRILYKAELAEDIGAIIITATEYPKGSKVPTKAGLMPDMASIPKYDINPFTATKEQMDEMYLQRAIKPDPRPILPVVYR